MRKARMFRALFLISIVFLPSGLAAQIPVPSTEELLYGTWELVPARSQYFQRETPRNQIMVFEPHEEGLQGTVIFINQDGEEERITYVAGRDGVPANLYGSDSFEAIVMQSQGPYRATAEFTHGGRVIATAERTISMDGREMMVRVQRMGNLSSRAVFVKRE